MDFRIYVILDRKYLTGNPEKLVQKIIEGGCSALQYRDKSSSAKDFFRLAQKIYRVAREKKIPFIINDRVDIALSLDAEGVHLGSDDLPLEYARRLLGSDRIIGRSAHNLEEAETAEREGADYLGVGAVFPTRTKAEARILISKSLAGKIKEESKIPVVAVGGITAGNVKELVKLGIENFAISSDILRAKDPAEQIKNIRAKLGI